MAAWAYSSHTYSGGSGAHTIPQSAVHPPIQSSCIASAAPLLAWHKCRLMESHGALQSPSHTSSVMKGGSITTQSKAPCSSTGMASGARKSYLAVASKGKGSCSGRMVQRACNLQLGPVICRGQASRCWQEPKNKKACANSTLNPHPYLQKCFSFAHCSSKSKTQLASRSADPCTEVCQKVPCDIVFAIGSNAIQHETTMQACSSHAEGLSADLGQTEVDARC